MMPVGVMYQSPTWKRVDCSHRTAGSLDADRLEAHHEREAAGEEQSRQRGDERLHVEVLHEDADEQADHGARTRIVTGTTTHGGHPVAEQLGAAGSR